MMKSRLLLLAALLLTAAAASLATWAVLSRRPPATPAIDRPELQPAPDRRVVLYIPGLHGKNCEMAVERTRVRVAPHPQDVLRELAGAYLQRIDETAPAFRHAFLDGSGTVWLHLPDPAWIEAQRGTCAQWEVLEGLATTLAANVEPVRNLRLVFDRPVSPLYPFDLSRPIAPRLREIDRAGQPG